MYLWIKDTKCPTKHEAKRCSNSHGNNLNGITVLTTKGIFFHIKMFRNEKSSTILNQSGCWLSKWTTAADMSVFKVEYLISLQNMVRCYGSQVGHQHHLRGSHQILCPQGCKVTVKTQFFSISNFYFFRQGLKSSSFKKIILKDREDILYFDVFRSWI